MLEILFHNTLDSTQLEAKRLLKGGKASPFCVVADIQTAGVGSRANRWESHHGNLFFSFVIHRNMLPADLVLSSASIYFGFLMKNVLETAGSEVWLKWPNDLYVGGKKVGGIITHVSGENLICGIGVNLVGGGEYIGLDVKTDKKTLINAYITELKKFPEWKKIFRQFRIEFEQSKRLKTHIDGEEISLENASLECDGSLTINGKRVFSLR